MFSLRPLVLIVAAAKMPKTKSNENDSVREVLKDEERSALAATLDEDLETYKKYRWATDCYTNGTTSNWYSIASIFWRHSLRRLYLLSPLQSAVFVVAPFSNQACAAEIFKLSWLWSRIKL
uniref:Uncharacterized protein n=1 Tax=Parascaris equorum TaxID=6256 RepID=A0A914RZD9_PAREQ